MRFALPLCLSLLVSVPAMAEIEAPQGHVLITLGGNVTETNLPARTSEDGGLFGFLEIAYERATGFDAAMLDGLPQVEIMISYGPEGKERDITFTGPLLQDVMEMAGASGTTAKPMAMDGYQAEISWSDIETSQPILATHADGAPMGIGAYGPTMIVFPHSEDPEVQEAQAAQQVWALAFIEIE